MTENTKIGRIIYASSISDAWYRGLNIISNHGKKITDERGGVIKEYLNLLIVLNNPYIDKIPKESSWNVERLDEYSRQLITGDNPQNFEYTYGQRLRNWDEKIDQIDYVIKKLKRSKTTRRATAVTWIPTIDTKVDEAPCMIVNDFKIRDEKVHLTSLFRSHDFAGAYPANMYALTKLLGFVAENVGLEPGTITNLSISAHIYDHDFDKIEEIVRGI